LGNYLPTTEMVSIPQYEQESNVLDALV
jgi:hypothetical protein